MKIKRILKFTFLFLLIVSCNKQNEAVFEQTPSERMKNAKEDFKKILIEQTNGWEMVYFADTKEIFNSLTTNIKKSDPYALIQIEKYYGKGGHYFIVNFQEDGKVQMLSEIDFSSSQTLKESNYTITQNTYLQLNFTSPNYIFETGQTSFLFFQRQQDGSLLFTTNKYDDPNREYILLKPISEDKTQQISKMASVFATKLDYERKMINGYARLRITDEFGDLVFENTEIGAKYSSSEKRYTVFAKNMEPHKTGGVISDYYIALGSGYVPGDNKMKFMPGFRINDTICFTDFEKQGYRYISQLKGFTAVIE